MMGIPMACSGIVLSNVAPPQLVRKEGGREGGRKGGKEGLTCGHDGHADRLLGDSIIKFGTSAAGRVGPVVVVRPETVAGEVDL